MAGKAEEEARKREGAGKRKGKGKRGYAKEGGIEGAQSPRITHCFSVKYLPTDSRSLYPSSRFLCQLGVSLVIKFAD